MLGTFDEIAMLQAPNFNESNKHQFDMFCM